MNEAALAKHYRQLYTDSITKIREEGVVTDELLDAPSDDRRGITLLIRPDNEVKKRILLWLEMMKETEPDQYYYPASDLHITLLSVISCYSGFHPEQIDLPSYNQLIRESMAGEDSFSIRMKGITASPSGVMIQGFSENDRLNQLRENLRKQFKKSKLQQSIDRRYVLQTAHSTVIRFRKPLQHKDTFLDKLEQFRDFDFGTFQVKEIELVTNDWYLRKEKVSTLNHFPLG